MKPSTNCQWIERDCQHAVLDQHPQPGCFADPRVVASVAKLAEGAGWDGLFVWDHLIGYNRDLVSDFGATNILLAAADVLRVRHLVRIYSGGL